MGRHLILPSLRCGPVASLRVTHVSVERLFSAMRVLPSDLRSRLKQDTVEAISVVQPAGRDRGAILPPLRLWGQFSIRTIKYCNLSLSKFNENKQITCFVVGSKRVNFKNQAAIPSSRGPFLGTKAAPLLESKVGENG